MNIEVTPFNYVNFTCRKGDSFIKSIEVLNDADETFFDFDGFTAIMQVRKREGAEAVETFTTSDNTILLQDGLLTLDKLAITAPAGSYVYDLQIRKDGRNTTLLSGDFVVKPDYTP